MKEKESYSPDEIAQICEAYHRIYSSSLDTMENLKKYKGFIPQTVQESIAHLRNVELAFYEKTPQQKEEIEKDWEKWFTGSEKFAEFFKVFK